MERPFTIVFILFPRLTQLDFTGPFEVLQRLPGARLVVASREGGSLTADSGLTFAGLARLSDITEADAICVPGGHGLTEALGDRELVAHVQRLGRGARYVTSVCTGSLLLAAAGLLEGKRAACHWAFRPLLAELGIQTEAARVVRDGNVITGGGVTAGIDFALTLVAEIAGADVARAIQLSIEYDPQPPFDAGSPETAPAEVLTRVRDRVLLQYPERRAALLAARAALARPV
ncbi:DJ-1/PfpI family protein [Sorangium sp. So ce448]|uniref:DJ-1/PfpI family protein n=1 Tax=Sorangium sp. So ce448 TaxID=3133314 RepID=UPI003F62C186